MAMLVYPQLRNGAWKRLLELATNDMNLRFEDRRWNERREKKRKRRLKPVGNLH